MDIAEALDHLGRRIGLDLRLDAARACRLVVDGRVAIDIEAPEDPAGLMFLSSTVGLLPPPDRRRPVLESLLAANLFGRDTGPTVLAIDADLGEVVLFRRMALGDVTEDGFTAALEDLVARAEVWTERLARAPLEPPAPADFGLYALRV